MSNKEYNADNLAPGVYLTITEGYGYNHRKIANRKIVTDEYIMWAQEQEEESKPFGYQDLKKCYIVLGIGGERRSEDIIIEVVEKNEPDWINVY
jgi:hypothetical protein